MEPPLLADFDNKHNIPTQNSVICLTGKTKHHTMEDALSTGSNDTLHSIPTYRISHPAGYIQDPFPPGPNPVLCEGPICLSQVSNGWSSAFKSFFVDDLNA